MKIIIVAIGKTTTKYISQGIDQYLDRLKHYIPVEIIAIPDVKASRSLSAEQQKEQEGRQILSKLQPGDRLVLLDERGTQPTSRQFAGMIEQMTNQGLRRVVFAIGGPYGFSNEVYTRADSQLSLSRMTLTHEMVRLFFIEQLYRAMTILRGEPYHHD
ncbi:MAG: 23S rRNA (pseudouridine(1915)-N(3))-methyltransferase RlmH [Muribaculaceae bacterium]|nr:23S rRNA (pseudouridine(1915)-N(3))-methyltransferase RlmH [Muribaculaceae bacterium]